jgi:hypothetical protein
MPPQWRFANLAPEAEEDGNCNCHAAKKQPGRTNGRFTFARPGLGGDALPPILSVFTVFLAWLRQKSLGNGASSVPVAGDFDHWSGMSR